MKKTFVFFCLFIFSQLLLAENNIHLVKNGPLIDPHDDGRSIENAVTASIDGQVVTVSFSELAASQIVVTDSAELTVYDQTYAPAYSAQANLFSLPSGSYTLHIYAFGMWWYGDFTLQ